MHCSTGMKEQLGYIQIHEIKVVMDNLQKLYVSQTFYFKVNLMWDGKQEMYTMFLYNKIIFFSKNHDYISTIQLHMVKGNLYS
jgi:hypothetical protein